MNPDRFSSNGNGAQAVRALLGAVRRRLWRERFVVAARAALWAWAAVVSATAALHLAVGQPRLAVALALAAAAGAAALLRAALQRPTDAESALYADRHLGGESAYSTWLEARADADADGAQDTPALRRLAQWTAAAVPGSRSALEELHVPPRLARPLAAAAICTAVAALVTALPAAERIVPGEPARPAGTSRPVERLSLEDDALARELAAELSTPAGSPVGPEDPGRGSMQRARDSGASPADAVAGEPRATQPADSRDGARQATAAEGAMATAGDDSRAIPPHAAATPGEASAARATGSGREAGTSRDEFAEAGHSRALPGAMAVQRRDVTRPGEDSTRQADMTQAGIYEGDATTATGAAAALPEAAAAHPPAAVRTATLTPAESTYVTAWVEAARAARVEQR